MTATKWLTKGVNLPAKARSSRFLAASIKLCIQPKTNFREFKFPSVQDHFTKMSNELKIFSLENLAFPSNPFRGFQCVNFSFIYCCSLQSACAAFPTVFMLSVCQHVKTKLRTEKSEVEFLIRNYNERSSRKTSLQWTRRVINHESETLVVVKARKTDRCSSVFTWKLSQRLDSRTNQ